MKHSLICTTALCSLLLMAVAQPVAFAQKGKSTHAKTTTKRSTKSTSTTGQYPESSERKLTESDVEHVTPWGAKIMMNEIYARHGFIFKDAAMRKHFKKEKWYKGTEKSMKKIKLTDTEIQNIAFIREHQPKAKL